MNILSNKDDLRRDYYKLGGYESDESTIALIE